MTEEPVYEFVPGRGWVILPNSFHVTFEGGKQATVYNRLPVIGEYYTYIGKNSRAAKMHGDNFEGHCKWLQGTGWYHSFKGELSEDIYYYYTVVFVD